MLPSYHNCVTNYAVTTKKLIVDMTKKGTWKLNRNKVKLS